jgi:hypothetical protein
LILPAAARAEALARAVGAIPVGIILDGAKVYVVEILEAKATKFPTASNLQIFFKTVAPLFVFYQALEN